MAVNEMFFFFILRKKLKFYEQKSPPEKILLHNIGYKTGGHFARKF